MSFVVMRMQRSKGVGTNHWPKLHTFCSRKLTTNFGREQGISNSFIFFMRQLGMQRKLIHMRGRVGLTRKSNVLRFVRGTAAKATRTPRISIGKVDSTSQPRYFKMFRGTASIRSRALQVVCWVCWDCKFCLGAGTKATAWGFKSDGQLPSPAYRNANKLPTLNFGKCWSKLTACF